VHFSARRKKQGRSDSLVFTNNGSRVAGAVGKGRTKEGTLRQQGKNNGEIALKASA